MSADLLGDAINALKSLQAGGNRLVLPPEALQCLREITQAHIDTCQAFDTIEQLLKLQAARSSDAFEVTTTDPTGRTVRMTVRRIPGGNAAPNITVTPRAGIN